MKLRRTGAIGRKKPMAMQARQVTISNTAFAAILTTPRLVWAARKLPYQSRANATIAAAIRMARLLFALSLALHFRRMRGKRSKLARGPRLVGPAGQKNRHRTKVKSSLRGRAPPARIRRAKSAHSRQPA